MSVAVRRIQCDYKLIQDNPIPFVRAEPLPSDIFEWHFCLKGLEYTPFYGGCYHGSLRFSHMFPYEPPKIYMQTPNGCFETNRKLCVKTLKENWTPTLRISSLLTSLQCSLHDIEIKLRFTKELARKSLEFNLKNPNFRELFPDIVVDIEKRLQDLNKKIDFDIVE